MALKLRRGTDAQRLLITPAEGELIYTTDTKLLYVGDGTTAGGVAVDSGAATTFLGIASNITPDVTNTRNIGAVGNVYATGRFTSLFGNLTGNVSGNVTGNVTGNLTGNVDGNVTGDLVGSVFADDSSTVIDSIQKKIFGSIYSNINGNLYVSVDPSNNYLTNGDIVMQDNVITLLNGLDTIQFGANNSALGVGLNIKSSVISNKSIQINSLTDGTDNDSFEFRVSRGTLSIPTSLNQGDPMHTLVFRGWDGSSYVLSSALFAQVESDTGNPVGPGSIPGTIGFATTDDNGTTFKTLIFNSFGQLGVNTQVPLATLHVEGDSYFTNDITMEKSGGSNNYIIYKHGLTGAQKLISGQEYGTYTQLVTNNSETFTTVSYLAANFKAAKVTLHVAWGANDNYIDEFTIINTGGVATVSPITGALQSNGTNPVSSVAVDVNGGLVRLRVTTVNTITAGTVYKWNAYFQIFNTY